MNTRIFITSLFVILVLGGVSLMMYSNSSLVSSLGGSNNVVEQNDHRRIPDITFHDYDGKPVSLIDFIGKPIVVNSWAKWCLFCVDELPDFAALQDEFGDNVVFIGIDRAEPLSVAKTFTDNLGITSKMIFLLDPDDNFHRAIGGFTMPETIFVDAEGRIRFQKKGVMRIEEIRHRSKELL